MTSTISVSEIIAEFFSRFGSGDRAATVALFAPEVDFLVAGADFVPWTGARRTPAEIEEFLASAIEEVTTEDFDVERVIADGDHGVVLGRFTHRVNRTGKAFTSRFALHIEVADGLIRRYHMFEDSYAIAEAFGA